MNGRSATRQASASCLCGEDSASPRDSDDSEDAAFDSIYPPPIRAISRRFWTPVAVARRRSAAVPGSRRAECGRRRLGRRQVRPRRSLRRHPRCASSASSSASTSSTPLEGRRRGCRYRTPSSAVGDATEVPRLGFDGLYFFNPFAENLFVDGDQIDDAVELTESRFFRDVLRIERGLREAPLGTAVVTYHGMSGRMPACYELSETERAGSDWLRLWVKKRERAEGFFLEIDDRVVLHRASGAPA